MEIWLDSVDLGLIEEASNLGILKGVTTNPSLMSKLAMKPTDFIKKVLHIHNGPIAIQVMNQHKQIMLEEARKIHSFHPNIIIKIPITTAGLLVISKLVKENIPCMATAIYTELQFLLAGTLGCDYAAPYLGRMQENGIDVQSAIAMMQTIILQQEFEIKLLAAAIRNVNQIVCCANLGVKAVTLSDKVFNEFISTHSLTEQALHQFAKDWEKRFPSMSLFEGETS